MALETPIRSRTAAGYHLAYPRGWDDARLYSIVLIASGKTDAWSGDQLATVDDFGDLVVIADKAGALLPHLNPRFPLWIQRGDVEMH